jgi:hypothetical protein
MSLAKVAQSTLEKEKETYIGSPSPKEYHIDDISFEDDMDDENYDDFGLFEPDLFVTDEPDLFDPNETDEDSNDLKGQGEISIQIGDQEPVIKTFNFVLPDVPGGENQDPIEEPAELEVEEPEDEIEVEEPDVWDWLKRGGVVAFPDWLHDMMCNVPRHSGHDTAGIERAVAFLAAVDREISKVVRMDLKGELDISILEKARDEIHRGVDRLQERLERILSHKRPKKKKKADAEYEGIVKEAQKIYGVQNGGVMITVPLLISRIARSCINGMVSAGHDIEDLYQKQAKLYNLTVREKAEVLQLLEDMGYPMRRDRGLHPDEPIDRTRSDNVDWAANYPG